MFFFSCLRAPLLHAHPLPSSLVIQRQSYIANAHIRGLYMDCTFSFGGNKCETGTQGQVLLSRHFTSLFFFPFSLFSYKLLNLATVTPLGNAVPVAHTVVRKGDARAYKLLLAHTILAGGQLPKFIMVDDGAAEESAVVGLLGEAIMFVGRSLGRKREGRSDGGRTEGKRGGGEQWPSPSSVAVRRLPRRCHHILVYLSAAGTR